MFIFSFNKIGHLEIVKILIQNGANIHESNNSGNAPIHWAASNGHLEMVKFLMRNGVDFRIGDNAIRTPLHWSSKKGK